MITVLDVDVRGLNHSMKDWARHMGFSMPTAARVTAARILKDVIKWTTPPRTKGQGRKRVKRDVENAIKYVPKGSIISPVAKRLATKNPQRGAEFMFGVGSKHITPAEFYLEHERMRSKRGGVRKRKRTKRAVAFDSIAAYIRRRQRYVGLAKAGWVVAFQRARVAVRRYTLSGGRSAAPKDVPAWVKPRNFGRAARVGMSKDTLKFGRRGFFLATNASPWARYPTTVRRSISWVIRKRLRSMENETAFLAARSARAAKFSVPKTVRAASMPASIF